MGDFEPNILKDDSLNDWSRIEALVEQKDGDPNQLEGRALVAMYLLRCAGESMPNELKTKCYKFYKSQESRYKDDPDNNIFLATRQALDGLGKEVDFYFRFAPTTKNLSHAYWEQRPLGNSVADEIVKFECSRISQDFQTKLTRPESHVIEVYQNPLNHHHGVWMSIKGMHFDPSLVNNSKKTA